MPKSEVHLMDCMEFMKGLPDKAFSLAIVDPEYGIGRDGGETGKNWKWYEPKEWDDKRPSPEYFKELFRVSNNQIIFGANYFTDHLPPSMGWIVWDKGQKLTMSDGELAFTSFERALRIVEFNRCYNGEYGGLLHPTQKSVRLYKWILSNYAKEGDTIFDSHMGSQSSRIAAYDLGFDYVGCELDPDYMREGNQRFELFKSQGKLF